MHDPVPGWYYAEQLKLASKPTESTDWTIEKVLKERKVKGKKEVLVKFLFYPNKFNLWIPAENIKEGSI
jgi:AAA+ superfamily predicted ATPase